MTTRNQRRGMGKRYAEETTAEHGRERWGGGTRSRSPPREGQAFRSSGYYQGTDEGDRRVFVCWNKFVSEDFLYAHFERFGRVEHIYKAHGGQYGFVNFSKEEVGRSLLGEVHNVEGVQLKINRAKPDMLTARIREDRGGRYAVRTRSEVCALFREGRCLRGNYCEFQHIGESPRTSQESWQDNSYEKQRSRGRRRSTSEEQLWAHESTYGIKANNIRKEGSSHSALHLTGSKERDGRLRPPPSTKKKKRRVSLQVSPECKSPVHEKHSKEEVVEESSIRSTNSLNREKVQEDQSRVIVCIEKRQTSSKREKTKEKHRSQVSKECNKSKRKKEGKMSKEFLASLGLSDPIGAMAGVVSMSTGPLKTQDDEPIKTDEPVDNAEQIPISSTIKSLVQARSAKTKRGPGVAEGRNKSDTDNMDKDAIAVCRGEKEEEEEDKAQEDTVPMIDDKMKRKLRGLILLTMAKKIRQLEEAITEKDGVEKMAKRIGQLEKA